MEIAHTVVEIAVTLWSVFEQDMTRWVGLPARHGLLMIAIKLLFVTFEFAKLFAVSLVYRAHVAMKDEIREQMLLQNVATATNSDLNVYPATEQKKNTLVGIL